MKGTELTSPETRRVLFAARNVSLLALAALIGYLIPTPLEDVQTRLIDAFLSVSSGILAWGIVRLFQPARCGPGWKMVKVLAVPVLWCSILLTAAIWLRQNSKAFMDAMDRLLSLFNRL